MTEDSIAEAHAASARLWYALPAHSTRQQWTKEKEEVRITAMHTFHFSQALAELSLDP